MSDVIDKMKEVFSKGVNKLKEILSDSVDKVMFDNKFSCVN